MEELADPERAGARLEGLIDDLPPAEREAVLARVVRERSYLEPSALEDPLTARSKIAPPGRAAHGTTARATAPGHGASMPRPSGSGTITRLRGRLRGCAACRS